MRYFRQKKHPGLMFMTNDEMTKWKGLWAKNWAYLSIKDWNDLTYLYEEMTYEEAFIEIL